MQIAYNGVQLLVVKSNVNTRQVVSSDDNGDYLWTKFVFDVTCIYNPGATSFTGVPPTATPGIFPAVTDKAIRHQLMEKRRQLIVSDEVSNIMTSPSNGAVMDCQGGPHPISCDVRQFSGSKTWIVAYRIETYVDECPNNSQPDALVSNRWTQSHDIDDKYLTMITTQGIAHFRLDRLTQLIDQSADQFRDRCLPPIPIGFRREGVHVSLNSMGNVLTYSVRDRQQTTFLGDKNSPHPDVLDFDGSYIQSTATGPDGVPLPYVIAGCEVQVTGIPSALRANLFRFAAAMLVRKLNLPGPGNAGLSNGIVVEMSAVESIRNPYVELRAKVKLAPAKSGKSGLGGLRSEFLLADGIVYQTQNPNLSADGTTRQLPNDLNTRGSYAGEIFATALQVACSTVTLPAAPKGKLVSSGGQATPSYTVPVSTDQTGDMGYTTTSYSDQNTDAASFSEYKVDSRWDKNHHVMIVPTATTVVGSDTGSLGSAAAGLTSFLQMATPTSTRVVDWTAERTGQHPPAPRPVLGDPNYVLLRSSITPAAPELMNDGTTPIYRMSGQYVYGVRNAIGAGADLPLCVVPPNKISFDDPGSTYAAREYMTGIIESGSGGGSSQNSIGNDN